MNIRVAIFTGISSGVSSVTMIYSSRNKERMFVLCNPLMEPINAAGLQSAGKQDLLTNVAFIMVKSRGGWFKQTSRSPGCSYASDLAVEKRHRG